MPGAVAAWSTGANDSYSYYDVNRLPANASRTLPVPRDPLPLPPDAAAPASVPTADGVVLPGTRRQRETTSAELLGDARELAIDHDGARYVLRLTRQNKLILTK